VLKLDNSPLRCNQKKSADLRPAGGKPVFYAIRFFLLPRPARTDGRPRKQSYETRGRLERSGTVITIFIDCRHLLSNCHP